MTGPWLGTFVVTLIAVAVAMLGLGVGLLIMGRPLRGSCGGTGCDRLCDRPNPLCDALEEPT
jgi:hypothetical protein